MIDLDNFPIEILNNDASLGIAPSLKTNHPDEWIKIDNEIIKKLKEINKKDRINKQMHSCHVRKGGVNAHLDIPSTLEFIKNTMNTIKGEK